MTGSYYKPSKLQGIENGTRDGYHIRGSVNGDPKGMWQAWNDDTYLTGANGPMSLFAIGAFLYALKDKTYEGHHPGLDWFPPPEPKEETVDFKEAASQLAAKGYQIEVYSDRIKFQRPFFEEEINVDNGRVKKSSLDIILNW